MSGSGVELFPAPALARQDVPDSRLAHAQAFDHNQAMTIDELRASLDEVDRRIIALAGTRQQLARAIGEVKEREARPVRDFAREKDVIQPARRVATESGMAPDIADELMNVLIRNSLTVQERHRVEASDQGGGRRALVIGGAGRMGGWFVQLLASQSFGVAVADPAMPNVELPHVPDWRTLALDHDLIVVAAPLRATATILTALAERRPAGVVFDIGSLKSPLREPLRDLVAAGVKVTSIHPMFGPDTALLSGCHVIRVDLGVPEANQMADALFASTMATVVPMDFEQHDRAVAWVLGLSHALNIAFFTALSGSRAPAIDLTHLSPTTFNQQLSVASRVAGENPHLYFEIQHLNDYGAESLAALRAAVERLQTVVRTGDEAGFEALMERGRQYLAGRGE